MQCDGQQTPLAGGIVVARGRGTLFKGAVDDDELDAVLATDGVVDVAGIGTVDEDCAREEEKEGLDYVDLLRRRDPPEARALHWQGLSAKTNALLVKATRRRRTAWVPCQAEGRCRLIRAQRRPAATGLGGS